MVVCGLGRFHQFFRSNRKRLFLFTTSLSNIKCIDLEKEEPTLTLIALFGSHTITSSEKTLPTIRASTKELGPIRNYGFESRMLIISS